jgi:hypothetical protein
MRPAQVKTKLYGTQMRPLWKRATRFNTARTCLLLGITGSKRGATNDREAKGCLLLLPAAHKQWLNQFVFNFS